MATDTGVGNNLFKEFIGKVMHQNKGVDAASIDVNKENEKKSSEKFSGDTDTTIAALMKLTGTPHIAVLEPEVSEKNGALTLYGIVDAFWKRAYLGDIMKNDFPDMYVENNLTVITPREDAFLPEKNPVREPEMFHRARAMSHKKHTP